MQCKWSKIRGELSLSIVAVMFEKFELQYSLKKLEKLKLQYSLSKGLGKLNWSKV